MDYNARHYSPVLGRFVSPDTVVPDFANPQSLNRYTYTYNNPVRYYDSDGHCAPFCLIVGLGLAFEYLPRETLSAGAREVAQSDIPIASDLAKMDVYATDQLWNAVHGDEIGLSNEERVYSYANGSIALAAEGAVAVASALALQSGKDIANTVWKGIQGEIAVRTGNYPGAAANAAQFAEENGMTITPKTFPGYAGATSSPNGFNISGFNAANILLGKSVEENLGRTIIHECQHCLDLRRLGIENLTKAYESLRPILEESAKATEEIWANNQGF
jgi:hypothetical protein